MVDLFFIGVFLCALVGFGSRRIDRAFVDADAYAIGYLDNERVFFDVTDFAVDAAGCDDAVTFAE